MCAWGLDPPCQFSRPRRGEFQARLCAASFLATGQSLLALTLDLSTACTAQRTPGISTHACLLSAMEMAVRRARPGAGPASTWKNADSPACQLKPAAPRQSAPKAHKIKLQAAWAVDSACQRTSGPGRRPQTDPGAAVGGPPSISWNLPEQCPASHVSWAVIPPHFCTRLCQNRRTQGTILVSLLLPINAVKQHADSGERNRGAR